MAKLRLLEHGAACSHLLWVGRAAQGWTAALCSLCGLASLPPHALPGLGWLLLRLVPPSPAGAAHWSACCAVMYLRAAVAPAEQPVADGLRLCCRDLLCLAAMTRLPP